MTKSITLNGAKESFSLFTLGISHDDVYEKFFIKEVGKVQLIQQAQ